uniref:Uncharacterized protein n=1 Tax=Fagus sylvatica TaxID=28930 RepID=A0A2N9H2M6_FAGSY
MALASRSHHAASGYRSLNSLGGSYVLVVLGLFVASWISQRFSAPPILFLVSDLSGSCLALSNLGGDFSDLASSRDFSGCFDLGTFSLDGRTIGWHAKGSDPPVMNTPSPSLSLRRNFLSLAPVVTRTPSDLIRPPASLSHARDGGGFGLPIWWWGLGYGVAGVVVVAVVLRKI